MVPAVVVPLGRPKAGYLVLTGLGERGLRRSGIVMPHADGK